MLWLLDLPLKDIQRREKDEQSYSDLRKGHQDLDEYCIVMMITMMIITMMI
jgi:hypothetical protein